MDSNKEILSLLKSLELQIVKLENRILCLENKIDTIAVIRPSNIPFKPIVYPPTPLKPNFPDNPQNPFFR